MNIDRRVWAGTICIRTCLDTTDVTLRYVGQKCYFADRISDFTDINKTRLGTLTAIDGTRTSPFCMDHAVFFPFMIPADDVTDEKAFKQALDRENDDGEHSHKENAYAETDGPLVARHLIKPSFRRLDV